MLSRKSIFIIILLGSSAILNNLFGVAGWENPELISLNKFQNKYPDFFQYNNKTHITWVSYNINKIPSIYYNFKDIKWKKPVLVIKLNKNKIVYPKITIQDNNILIILSDENNVLQLFYKNINSSDSFNKITLNSNETFSILPEICSLNQKHIVFYQKYKTEKEFVIKYFPDISPDKNNYSPHMLMAIKQQEYGSFFPVVQEYNKKIFISWLGRFGKENSRNDVVSLKYSSENMMKWSDNIMLSEINKDAKYPDFIVRDNKLYLAYYTSEYIDNKYISSLITKIYDLSGFETIFTNRINLEFAEYYKLKLNYYNDKFYLIWYSYVNRYAQIFYIESDNFNHWSDPEKITKGGHNKLIKSASTDLMAIAYEKKLKTKTLIYYQEKDIQCRPPKIYSTTHKSNIWSYKNSVVLKWKEPKDNSGIRSYAYLFDTKPDTIPEIENLPANFTGKSFEDLENGIHYLHLSAIDGAGNFSPPVHYKVKINAGAPLSPDIFSSSHEEFIPSLNTSPSLFWKMKDNRPIRGYSYILTQDEDAIPDQKINKTKTNIIFKNIRPGVWYFKIKACDPFNRWSDYSTYTLSIERIIVASIASVSAESRFSYIVKPGDVLSQIIKKILKTRKKREWRDYEKAVGKFNYFQNLDFLKPGDIVMFPIIIAKPSDTPEKISRDIFGTEDHTEKIVVVGDDNVVMSAGDRVIIKDKYFLKTGKIKGKEEEEEK